MKRVFPWVGAIVLYFLVLPISAEEITIVGTGSGPPILKAIGAAFTKQNPEVRIVVPHSIGSGGGIKAVGNDEYLLARVARGIKEKEKQYNLSYTPIARIPIVFYANRNVTIKSLATEQVCGIYSGKIFNWQEVGGHSARIRVITRQDGDSSLSVLLKSFPNFNDIVITELSKTTYSDPDTIKLTEITSDAIAFGSYSDVMKRAVNILNINQISPTDDAYSYFGIFGLVYKEKNRTGTINKFIDFATSAAAYGPIKESGGLPLN